MATSFCPTAIGHYSPRKSLCIAHFDELLRQCRAATWRTQVRFGSKAPRRNCTERFRSTPMSRNIDRGPALRPGARHGLCGCAVVRLALLCLCADRDSLRCRDDTLRFGFADRRQVDRALAIIVGGRRGDRAGDGRGHRDRSYVVHLFI
jgi:hypothetical protein